MTNLVNVLNRLEEAGVCLKTEQVQVYAPEFRLSRTVISEKGLQPSEKKLTEAPTPQDISTMILTNHCCWLTVLHLMALERFCHTILKMVLKDQ